MRPQAVREILNPRVSIVIAAYNLAAYLPRAIDSALAQIPPGGPCEVIVIDDGSSDATPDVLARYGDRIRAVRQPNAGTNTAVDHGIELATGEYIALLDADDEWPVDRLRRHVATLDSDPRLGLVHGDMEVIDSEGATLAPSYFGLTGMWVPSGRVLGSLLAGNFVSGGASTFRSSLKAAFHPIPADAAYHDWSVATCIACVAEIGLAQGIANRYRFRGGNDSLGRPPSETARVQRRELPWRRWMFRNVVCDPGVTAQELRGAYNGLIYGLNAAGSSDPKGLAAEFGPDPARAASLSRASPDPGAGARRSRALLRAASYNPFDRELAREFELAVTVESSLPPYPPAEPLILLHARRRVAIGWFDEVLRRPELLHAFAAEHSGDDSTLAVLTPPGADLRPLIELFEVNPDLSAEGCDVTAVTEPRTTPARAWLGGRASSLLSTESEPRGFAHLPADPALERLAHGS